VKSLADPQARPGASRSSWGTRGCWDGRRRSVGLAARIRTIGTPEDASGEPGVIEVIDGRVSTWALTSGGASIRRTEAAVR